MLLATFCGVFTRQITIDLDTAARALAAHHGPFAVILDFTKVTELALQLRDWPQFATNRRAIRGTRRIMVAPPTDIFIRCVCTAPITAVPAKTPMWCRRGPRPIGNWDWHPRPSSRSHRFSARGAPASLAPPKG